MGHVTITTPPLGMVCHPQSRTRYIVYFYVKCETLALAAPHMVGAHQNVNSDLTRRSFQGWFSIRGL